jgi:angiopoietin 2/deleted-in-malignant-brain-tumors protein 1
LEYKHGFGSLYGEFWLGNEVLHLMTSQQKYQLCIDLWDWEGNFSRAEYESVKVDSEAKKYTLRVKNYLGGVGKSALTS